MLRDMKSKFLDKSNTIKESRCCDFASFPKLSVFAPLLENCYELIDACFVSLILLARPANANHSEGDTHHRSAGRDYSLGELKPSGTSMGRIEEPVALTPPSAASSAGHPRT